MPHFDLAMAFQGCKTNALTRKFSNFVDLDGGDLAILDEIASRGLNVPAEKVLYAEEEQLTTAGVLLTGWAYTMRRMADGRRQILRFILPGDCFGLSSNGPIWAIDTLVTLTPCTVADARKLIPLDNDPDRRIGLARACERSAALDHSYILSQIVRLGQQTAYERVASLVVEIEMRLQSVGLADETGFNMPLSQEVISDALGISLVHTNRNVQKLRQEKIITFSRHKLCVLDRAKLVQLAAGRHDEAHRLPGVQSPPDALIFPGPELKIARTQRRSIGRNRF